MKLYLKQKLFTWGDKFSVYDENGTPRYQVEGEVFTFGKKLHLFDACGMQVSFISETVTFFMPRFSLTVSIRFENALFFFRAMISPSASLHTR